MFKKLKNITGKSGSFRRNVMIMSGGSIFNILISLGLYPIVTRLYTKEDFGILGLFVAIVSTISLAGTALYPTGLVIPKFKKDFYALLKLSFILMIITILITSIIIIFFNKPFNFIFKAEKLGNLKYYIPLGILLSSSKTIFVNWNIRNKDFIHNATSNIVGSSSLKGINIFYALLNGASSFGLIISVLISTVLSIITLGVKNFIKGIIHLKLINKQDLKNISKEYIKYPKYLLPGNLINKYTSDLPIYMITAYYSPAFTGAFVLANNMMNLPLNIIGGSVANVFLQKSNELHLSNPKELTRFGEKVYNKLLLIGVIVFGFLFSFGDLLFGFYFGKKWILAGEISEILSVFFILKLISGPLTKIYRVVGKEHYALHVSIILAVARSIGIAFGLTTGDAFKTIIYFTIANFLGYLINTVYIYKAINLPIKKQLIKTILFICIGFLFFWTLRYGVDYFF